MGDLTLTSAVDQLQVTFDTDTQESDFCMYGDPMFKVSSSQRGALLDIYHNLASSDSNPTMFGIGGALETKLKIVCVEQSPTAWLYMGLRFSEQKVFRLSAGQWAALLRRYNEEYEI